MTGHSSKTVANFIDSLRQLVEQDVNDYKADGKGKIGGVGKIVEVDESKFGKRKYNEGHHVEGIPFHLSACCLV